MIVVRAPFRVSFLGGGSDIPSHYEQFGGAVLSTAVNQHIFLTGRKMFEPNRTLVKYSTSELVSDVGEIKHPIFREALQFFKTSGVDIGVSSDIPAGTGLGSSSTFTVALVSLLADLSGKTFSKMEIAELASYIEIELLNEPIGKQDQFASSFGGVNLFLFNKSGTVEVHPLYLKSSDFEWLQSSMFLVKLMEPPRSASEVLTSTALFQASNPKAVESTKDLASLAIRGYEEVNRFGIKILPDLLNEAWRLKQAASPISATSVASEAIEAGLRGGASAAKLLGAGGGGFVLFLVEEANRTKFQERMQSWKVVQVKTDLTGVSTIYSEGN